MVGSFGNISFVVSDDMVLTPKSISHTSTGKWAEHTNLRGKNYTEFVSKELSKVSMDITLSAALGVSPYEVIRKLERITKNGLISSIVIGGKRIGKTKYVITDMSETWDKVFVDGELYQASVTLTFREYV